MNELKVGLIGCGHIAQMVHLNILTKLSGVKVIGLAEPDPERGAQAKKKTHKAQLFTDYHDLLSISDLDAVVICVPPALHTEVALAAFEAEKHVYLEKPMATNLTDAQTIVRAWERADTVGMMGFSYRFHPLYGKIKQILRTHKLGEITAVRTSFCSASKELPSWKQSRQSGGGILLDLAPHHIDMSNYLFQEQIVEASCQMRSQESEDDTALVTWQLESGLSIQSFFSCRSIDEERWEIYGTTGKLTFERFTGLFELTSPTFQYGRPAQLMREIRTIIGGIRRVTKTPGEPSFQAALKAFVTAAGKGCSVTPSIQDGYRVQSILEATMKSAESGFATTRAASQYEGLARQ
ncbi:Gfo/Idh/MocA family oxidoreductase [Chloroflexi bacterium TSY]|nr:Gfo/Idh/MocA family oxidoreductase [Chloroflexi bacterium TSY]